MIVNGFSRVGQGYTRMLTQLEDAIKMPPRMVELGIMNLV
jgi:hypothetical protein